MNLSDDHCRNSLTAFAGYAQSADSKAAVLLTGAAAVTGGSLAALVDVMVLMKRLLQNGELFILHAFEVGLVVQFVMLGCCLGFLLIAIFPRLDPAAKRQSIFYFGTIARFSGVAEFQQFAADLTEQNIKDHQLDQLYSLAIVLKQKYKYIRLAVWMLSMGALASFLINGAALLSKGLNISINVGPIATP